MTYIYIVHTQHERMVPELIEVLGSHPAGYRRYNPAVGCHTFRQARGYLPSRRASLARTKLYCLMTHDCKQLAQGCSLKVTAAGSRIYMTSKSSAVTIAPSSRNEQGPVS